MDVTDDTLLRLTKKSKKTELAKMRTGNGDMAANLEKQEQGTQKMVNSTELCPDGLSKERRRESQVMAIRKGA